MTAIAFMCIPAVVVSILLSIFFGLKAALLRKPGVSFFWAGLMQNILNDPSL